MKLLNRKTITICTLLITAVLLHFSFVTLRQKQIEKGVVLAATSPWTQTDWSGGISGSTVSNEVSTYSFETGIDTSTNGQIEMYALDGWAYDTWSYRKEVEITNTAGSNQTEMQVYFEFDSQALISNSKLQDECQDIRLSDTEGVPLPYWIETGEYECDTANTRVWTKIDIPSEGVNLYMYYGNDSAEADEDGDAIFELFDDFSGVSIDTGKWTLGTLNATSGTQFYLLNGFLKGGNTNRFMDSVQSFTGNYQAEVRVQEITSANNGFSSVGFWQSTSNSWGILIHNGTTYLRNNGSWPNFGSFSRNLWSRDLTRVIGTAGYAERRAENDSELRTYTNTNSGGIVNERVRFGSRYDSSATNQNFDASWDWVYVKKAVINEPTASVIGDEEVKFPTIPGILESNIFDAEIPVDWGNLVYATTGSGDLAFLVRTDSNSDMSTAQDWSNCTHVISTTDLTESDCVDDATRYLQYRIEFNPVGGTSSVLEDLSVAFTPSDQVPPTDNATDLTIAGLDSSDDWHKDEPVISWTAGQDNVGGNGLLGYCLAIDEANIDSSNSLDPAFSSGILTGKDDGVPQEYCPFLVTSTEFDSTEIPGLSFVSGKQYYVSIKAVDSAGNIYTGSSETWQDVISMKYDDTGASPPFYISLPANFLASKDVVITCPVGVGGASDEHSGLAGLQYRIGEDGTWYGDLHTGTEDINDLLTNDGSYQTNETYDYPLLNEGNNFVYFRAVDNLGNVTPVEDYVKGILKLNTVAPSPVRNLSVSPSTNNQNSYAFDWEVPATFTGSASGISYCYTVNTIPSANTCTFTNAGVTELTADAFATQPGTNTLYVVAKDEAGNINYATYGEPGSSVEFSYSGSAPGIPLNVDAADISVKATKNWRLVISWDKPSNIGAGISYYNIYRSTQATSCSSTFSGFSKVGTSSSTSYIDPDLEQKNYSYCIKACDSANNCSASSSNVVTFPTGKFTSPAEMLSEPTASSVTTKKAVINWVTDRASDSKIQYGTESGIYFEAEVGTSLQTATHTVALDNLEPGTTYFYKAKWTDVDGNTGESEEKSFATLPPPQILEVQTSNIRTNSAIVTFTVDSATSVDVLYGQTVSYGGVQTVPTSTNESTYTVNLTGLSEDSVYNFKFILRDVEGNDYDSIENHRFNTLPLPRIQNVRLQEVKNSAQPTMQVTWETNVPTSSIVTYFRSNNPDRKKDQIELELITEHDIKISGLNADSNYGLLISGIDGLGNRTDSEELTFTTAADSRPPEISDVKLETRIASDSTEGVQAQIIVTWDTDEPATSQVEFGEGSGGEYTQKTLVDDNLANNHIVVINNLKASSVYHLRVVSSDSAGNKAEGRNLVTITAQTTENPLQVIIGRLTEVFGFVL